MFCKKCSYIGVLQALSQDTCKICSEPTPTPHIPSYKVCKTCSSKLNLCEQCGEEIKK